MQQQIKQGQVDLIQECQHVLINLNNHIDRSNNKIT